MKKVVGALAGTLAFVSAGNAAKPAARIGLKCVGQVRWSVMDSVSQSEDHYVVDRARRQLILRDAFSGKVITAYSLTVSPRQYSGERQEDGRTNGGFPVHHYDTVHISREDGSITSTSLSTTTFPNGPSTTRMTFEGSCVPENPDQRKSLKF